MDRESPATRREAHPSVLDGMDAGYLLADVMLGADGRAVDIHYVEENAAAVRLTGASLSASACGK